MERLLFGLIRGMHEYPTSSFDDRFEIAHLRARLAIMDLVDEFPGTSYEDLLEIAALRVELRNLDGPMSQSSLIHVG